MSRPNPVEPAALLPRRSTAPSGMPGPSSATTRQVCAATERVASMSSRMWTTPSTFSSPPADVTGAVSVRRRPGAVLRQPRGEVRRHCGGGRRWSTPGRDVRRELDTRRGAHDGCDFVGCGPSTRVRFEASAEHEVDLNGHRRQRLASLNESRPLRRCGIGWPRGSTSEHLAEQDSPSVDIRGRHRNPRAQALWRKIRQRAHHVPIGIDTIRFTGDRCDAEVDQLGPGR